jgi:hypothetical protein
MFNYLVKLLIFSAQLSKLTNNSKLTKTGKFTNMLK